MLITLSENNKTRIKEFIEGNDLDYTITDNDISRYQLISYDGVTYYIQESDGNFILIKQSIVNGSEKFDYLQYESLNKLLETLSIYDKQLEKIYWTIIMSDAEYGVDSQSYNEDWYSNIINEYYTIEERDPYKYLYYENFNYKPEIKSPHNTLHEVSPINSLSYNKLERLYFEIHPVSCKNERYILKLLHNDDEIFKEYINYYVWTEKGLNKLIESIFTEMERFKL
jgi:hypothetical protein